LHSGGMRSAPALGGGRPSPPGGGRPVMAARFGGEGQVGAVSGF